MNKIPYCAKTKSKRIRKENTVASSKTRLQDMNEDAEEQPQETHAYNPKTIIPGDTIRILNELDDEYLEGQTIMLDQLISGIPATNFKITDKQIAEMTSPDQDFIPNAKVPIIDFWLDCSDLPVFYMNRFLYQVARAKRKGIIIRTTVSGYCNGEVTKLAIQGTPGFRIMYESAQLSILFVQDSLALDEIGFKTKNNPGAQKNNKEKIFWDAYQEISKKTYLRHTGMSPQYISKMMENEFNQMNAHQCLKYKLCDWILTENGEYIKRAQSKQR